eukprot:s577_g15.t1
MRRISKHLSLACEGGAVYRLLLQGVSQQELEIQKDLLTAAYGAETRLHPAATSRIVGAVQRHQAKLGAVNASTALHLLAQATSGPTSLPSVATVATQLLHAATRPGAEPRDLAVASWASAKLQLSSSDALQALQDAIQASADRLDGQDVANVCWAFASVDSSVASRTHLFATLADAAVPKIRDHFSARHVAITCWALAKVRLPHDDFILAAAGAMQGSKAADWMPQDLSNFLWSSAALRCDLPLPLELIAQRAAQITWQQFKPQELSICMWAAYTLGVVDGRGASIRAVKRMLQHAAREIRVRGAQDFEARHLLNSAWALARWQRHCRLLGWQQECKDYVCRPALRILLEEAARNGGFQRFRPHELSRLIWAVASQSCLKLRPMGPPLLDYVRRPEKLMGFDPDALVSLVTSLAWILERLVWELPGRRTHSRIKKWTVERK